MLVSTSQEPTVSVRGKSRRVTVYSVRYNRQGQLVNAQPCAHCVDFLMKMGIQNTVYSTEDGELINSKLSELPKKLSSGNRY